MTAGLASLATLLSVALVSAAALTSADASAATPVYRNGSGTLDLSGPWKFRVGDDPSWADPSLDDRGWDSVTIPSGWGRDYGSGEIAWYRFAVHIEPGARTSADGLALTLGKIDSAYELYIDGALAGGVGVLPPATPQLDYDRHRIYPLPKATSSSELVVALRVWNSPWTRASVGGPHGGHFLLGSTTDAIWREFVSELHVIVFSSIFLLIGGLYLMLYRPRSKRLIYLWFGLLCWLTSIYGVLISQWRYRLSDDFVLLKGIEHVIVFLLVPLFIEVAWTASDLVINRLLRVVQALCVAFAIVAAVTPGLGTSLSLLPLFTALVIATAAAGTITALWTALVHRRGNVTMAIGASIAAGFFTRDTLIDRGVLHGPRLILIGFGIFLICIGISLSQQMRRRLSSFAQAKNYQLGLERSEELFRAISQQLPDHLYLVDLIDGTIIHANTTTAVALGIDAESMSAKPLGDLLDPTTRALWSETMKALPSGETIRFEGALEVRPGHTEPVELAARAIHYGDRRAALITARDISIQQAAKQALLASEEAAEQANLAKSDFLANMSHEIRTPMTAILGILELVLDEPLDGGLRKRLELVDGSARHLLDLVNEILDFSKIEAGKMVLERMDFNLDGVVRGAVSLMSPRAHARGIALSVDIAPEVPQRINSDPARIRQILLNLLTNAIKFTEEGSVVLRLSASADGACLRATVADTGIGISPEVMDQLFCPFKQADTSMSRRFGGTGLGLAISKQIAVLLGGDLSVESTLGEGSVFTMEWPLVAATTPAEPEQRARRSVPIPAPFPERWTVLVAEDNAINLMVIGALLKKLGLDVVTATDGAEALEALKEHEVHAVLMDCQMPEMDGYEATRRIRQLESGTDARLPIIALTAHAIDGERERCIAAGMDDFVSKPYRTYEMREVLDRWLRHASAAAVDNAAIAADRPPEPLDLVE